MQKSWLYSGNQKTQEKITAGPNKERIRQGRSERRGKPQKIRQFEKIRQLQKIIQSQRRSGPLTETIKCWPRQLKPSRIKDQLDAREQYQNRSQSLKRQGLKPNFKSKLISKLGSMVEKNSVKKPLNAKSW